MAISSRYLGLHSAALLIGLVFSAPALEAADLLTIYRAALENDATYAMAKSDYLAAEEVLPQARSQLLPTVGLRANVTRNRIDNTAEVLGNVIDRQYSFTSQDYGLSLTQPVYRKAIWAEYQSAGAKLRLATAELLNARLDLALRVVQTYFAALLAQDNIDLVREQKSAIAAQVEQAKRFYASGFGTVTDVNEAQARLDSANALEITARNNLEIAMRAFEEIVGNVPDTLLTLSAQPSLRLPDPYNLDHWRDHALANNPAVLAKSAALEIAQHEIEKARAQQFPTIDLVAGVGHAVDPGYTTLDQTNNSADIGIRAAFTLYQGGYITSRLRQTRALHDKARNELEAVRRQIAQQTRQEYLNVVNGVAQVDALEKALKSHEVALDSMQKGFRAGVRTSVDILNEQQLLYTAKRDLSEARYNYLISRSRLKAAAGILDEAEIVLINGWLNGVVAKQ